MLIIRLKPMGRKYRKHFRIVVAEKHRSVSKKVHATLGWYNPYSKEHSIDQAEVTKHLSHGAHMSDTVRSLFKKFGVAVDLSSTTSTKPIAKKTKVVSKTAASPAKSSASVAKKSTAKKS